MSIDAFEEFWRHRLEGISSLTVAYQLPDEGEQQHLEKAAAYAFQRILLVNAIEALAWYRNPKPKPRPRTVSFLNECTSWNDVERVSLPHLLRLLELLGHSRFHASHKWASERLAGWNSETPISKDPSLDEVKQVLPKGDRQNLVSRELRLDRLQHSHLFYSNRNSLVRVSRGQGFGMEMPGLERDSPYDVVAEIWG